MPELTMKAHDYIELFYQAHRVPISKKRLQMSLEMREFLNIWDNYSKIMECEYTIDIHPNLPINLHFTKVPSIVQTDDRQLHATVDVKMKTRSDNYALDETEDPTITEWKWLILVPVDELCQISMTENPIVIPRCIK